MHPSPSGANRLHPLSGETRVYLIVGDPIAQVKSPAGVSLALQHSGINGVVVPYQVSSDKFLGCMQGTLQAQNVDGLIVTMPHKFVATQLCHTLSARAAFLGAVNTLRRHADGSMHGDMFDGLAMVQAIGQKGGVIKGKSVLLIGAGGAGSAIAYDVCEAGAATLTIADQDAIRQHTLVQRLRTVGSTLVTAARRSGNRPVSPAGFDMVINATPMGMQPSDSPPFDAAQLQTNTLVADVVTVPDLPAHLAAARAAGCVSVSGGDMFVCVRDLMVAFFLAAGAAR